LSVLLAVLVPEAAPPVDDDAFAIQLPNVVLPVQVLAFMTIVLVSVLTASALEWLLLQKLSDMPRMRPGGVGEFGRSRGPLGFLGEGEMDRRVLVAVVVRLSSCSSETSLSLSVVERSRLVLKRRRSSGLDGKDVLELEGPSSVKEQVDVEFAGETPEKLSFSEGDTSPLGS